MPNRVIVAFLSAVFMVALVVAPPSEPAAAARCGLSHYTGTTTSTTAYKQSGTGYCRVQARIKRLTPGGNLYMKYSGWMNASAYVYSSYGSPWPYGGRNCARFREYDKPYNGKVIYTSPWSCKNG